jgi:hypothetical protein
VRYHQRTDGTILLEDCSIGITQRRKRRVIAAGAAALLAGGGLFMFLRSRGDDAPKSRITVSTEPESVMGLVAMQGQTMMGDVLVEDR